MLRVYRCVFCSVPLLFVYLRMQIQIQAPLRECRAIRLSASGLLYSCTTLVCVPDVIGMQTM